MLQRAAFLRGESAGTHLAPHHRHQLSVEQSGGIIDELPGPGHYLFSIAFPLELGPGRYVLSLGAAEPDLERHALGGNQLDRYRDASVLEVLPFELTEREPTPFFGLVRLPAEARDPVRLEAEDP